MNLIELNRALKQLRLGGMAAVLEDPFTAGSGPTDGPHRSDLLSDLR
jgi:hypothetical protein